MHVYAELSLVLHRLHTEYCDVKRFFKSKVVARANSMSANFVKSMVERVCVWGQRSASQLSGIKGQRLWKPKGFRFCLSFDGFPRLSLAHCAFYIVIVRGKNTSREP